MSSSFASGAFKILFIHIICVRLKIAVQPKGARVFLFPPVLNFHIIMETLSASAAQTFFIQVVT